jgi:hypothetical protein
MNSSSQFILLEKLDRNGSRTCRWGAKSGIVFLVSASPYPSCTMGTSPPLGYRQGPFKTLGPYSGWASLDSTHPPTFPLHLHVFLMGVWEWGSHNSQNCYFPEAMKQEQQLGTGSIPSSLQINIFYRHNLHGTTWNYNKAKFAWNWARNNIIIRIFPKI